MIQPTHHWRLATIITITLVFLFLIVGSTESFHDCIQDIKNADGPKQLNEKVFGVFSLFHHYRIIGQCALVGVDEHNGIVTAIAGITIACFTYTLWRSTDKLWQETSRAVTAAKDEFIAENRPWL